MIFAQVVMNGLMLGSIYLLMAVGFTLVFSIMRIINFAHGEFYMLGGVFTYLAVSVAGLDFVLALLLAGAGAFVIGVAVEFVVFRRFRGDEMSAMIAALGLSIIIQNVALLIFGPSPVSFDAPVSGAVALGPVIVPAPRLYVCVAALAIFALFYLFMAHTSTGRALRALAQDPEIARVQGIRINRMIPITFGIGVALAALAGGLMGPLFSVSPFTGMAPMLKAFVVVILGGLGSIAGAAVGGLLLGLVESFASTFIGGASAEILQLLVVILVLLFRPWGLLGQKEG